MRNYEKISQQYEEDILSGAITSNKLIRLAMERNRKDMARQATATFPYQFDQKFANKVCAFVECCPHLEGPLGGTLLVLEPWQVWLLSQIFGWVSTSAKRSGKRRFRRAFVEVARGNGKSFLCSALALYCMTIDNEAGPKIYSAATTGKQARLTFDAARQMVLHPAFRPTLSALKQKGHDFTVNADSLVITARNAKFEPVSSQCNTNDGYNIHLCILDEVHAHDDRTVYDVMKSGCNKRDQSLMLMITTAGTSLTSVGKEQHDYSEKLLNNIFADETYFAMPFGIDSEDDWRDENVWRKANPCFGSAVDEDGFRSDCIAAISNPAGQPNFLTKHLNCWLSGGVRWCDLDAWRAAQDPTLTLESMKQNKCWIGVDLAWIDDLAVVSLLFQYEKDGRTHYAVFNKYFLPTDTIMGARNAQYQGWHRQGYLTGIEGEVIVFQEIEDYIRECTAEYNVQRIGFDRYKANEMTQSLQACGIPIEYISQNVQTLSEPTKKAESLVKSGLMHTPVDPVFLWNCSNVECEYDTNENVKPRKAGKKIENKIDGYIAMIFALFLAMEEPPTQQPYQFYFFSPEDFRENPQAA